MTSIDRASHRTWLLVGIAIALIFSVALTVGLNYQRTSQISASTEQERDDIQCVTDWANATAARNERVLQLSNAKNAANDAVLRALAALLRDLTHATSTEVHALAVATQAYLVASNAYNNAIKLNPLPPSPQLACGIISKPVASLPSVVVTQTVPDGGSVTVTRPGAKSTTTATIGVPMPTTVTAPGVPVQVPGPTVTVTQARTTTRTVTHTVEPPPCFANFQLPPCLLTVNR